MVESKRVTEFMRHGNGALRSVAETLVDVNRSRCVFVEPVQRLRCSPELDFYECGVPSGNFDALVLPHGNRIIDAHELFIGCTACC